MLLAFRKVFKCILYNSGTKAWVFLSCSLDFTRLCDGLCLPEHSRAGCGAYRHCKSSASKSASRSQPGAFGTVVVNWLFFGSAEYSSASQGAAWPVNGIKSSTRWRVEPAKFAPVPKHIARPLCFPTAPLCLVAALNKKKKRSLSSFPVELTWLCGWLRQGCLYCCRLRPGP